MRHFDLNQYIYIHYMHGVKDLGDTYFESYLPKDYWHLT